MCALAVWFGLHPHLATRYTLPLSVVLALIVTQLLARGMTSPLREMTAAARAMARGDYTRRVRATSRDEVGELAHAFNRMAEDLGAVDRQRRELVANVSHELRTPISALQAVLENIVDGVSEPDPAMLRHRPGSRPSASAAWSSSCSTCPGSTRGATPLRLEPVGCRTSSGPAATRSSMSGRPVIVDLQVEPADLTVVADGERLHQVVANLLDNATRHSPDGGTVRHRRTRGRRRRRPRGHRRGPGHRTRATGPGSSSASTGAARRRATAAPASAWPSPAGSWTCTAAASASSTRPAGCRIRVVLPPPALGRAPRGLTARGPPPACRFGEGFAYIGVALPVQRDVA